MSVLSVRRGRSYVKDVGVASPEVREGNAFTSHRVIECNELLFVEQCCSVACGFQWEQDELIYRTYHAPSSLLKGLPSPR